jgi:hypothetical protein
MAATTTSVTSCASTMTPPKFADGSFSLDVTMRRLFPNTSATRYRTANATPMDAMSREIPSASRIGL